MNFALSEIQYIMTSIFFQVKKSFVTAMKYFRGSELLKPTKYIAVFIEYYSTGRLIYSLNLCYS